MGDLPEGFAAADVNGSFVIPGFGTIGGGVVGIGVGVYAGAAFGAAIGAGIGIAAGIDYCNTDDDCDEPKALPFPKGRADSSSSAKR